MGLLGGGGQCGLVERAEIIEGGVEELLLVLGEVPGRFQGDHFQRVDDGLRGAEVDLLLTGVGAGDLPEEEPGVLGLEDDEFIEPRIGFGHCWHGARIGILG